MSEGHGAALVGFAAAGIAYLVVESVVTFMLLGIAFGAFAVIVTAVSIIVYVARHPIRTARGWTLFLCGSATVLVLPFMFMFFAVMHGHTEVSGMTGLEDVGSLFAFAWLAGTALYVVPTLYQHIEQQGTPL